MSVITQKNGPWAYTYSLFDSFYKIPLDLFKKNAGAVI